MAKTGIESTPKGFVVTIGYKSTLPGVYTTALHANKALARYLGKPKLTRKKKNGEE